MMNVEYTYILHSFLPELVLLALALGVLAVDLLLPRANCRKAITLIAAVGCLFVAGLAVNQWLTTGAETPAFVQAIVRTSQPPVPAGELIAPAPLSYSRLFVGAESDPAHTPLRLSLGHPGFAAWWLFANDRFAAAFKLIIALAAFLVLLLSTRYPVEKYRGEFAGLLLFAAFGLMVMVNSLDLVVLFLGLETASLCLYALSAWHKGDARSAEAGTKYLLLGSLASAMFIYGASLLFLHFGSTHLSVISGLAAKPEPLLLVGFLLLLVGFSFKVAAAPFQQWAPDVYQGAPVSVAAFLSTASKAAGFAVLIRVLTLGFLNISAQWWQLVAIMAGASMLIGNLVAVHQNNMKRLLAYSGIAQAGYILIAVMALGLTEIKRLVTPVHEDGMLGVTAAVLYLFLYTVGNIGAFAIVGIVSRESGSEEMSAFAGLRTRAPLLAFAMLLLLLSLGGIPLLAGFVGKWFLFLSGVQEGQYLLVLLGAALSVVSIYYYLLVIKQMYILPAPDGARPIRVGAAAVIGLLLIVALTIAIGVYPAPFLDAARQTAQSLYLGRNW